MTVTSLDMVDALAIAAVAIWAAESAAILVGSMSNERRARQRNQLRVQLRTAGPVGVEALSRAARQLDLEDFQDLALSGLPPDIESVLARGLGDRTGLPQLRRLAEQDSSRPWARIAALQLLASARDRYAHPLLGRALRSGNARVSAAALRMLVRLNDAAAADVLIRTLRRGAYSRSRVAAAIQRLTVAHSPLVAPLLDAEDADLRGWGVRLAGRLNLRDLAPAVRRLVGDGDAVVRRVAVEALGRIGAADDRDLLRSRLLDPSPIVRAHAARALAPYADAAALESLADRLGDRDWIVRAAARDALAAHGANARAALVRIVWSDDRFAAEGAADLLQRAGVAEQVARQLLQAPTDAAAWKPLLRRIVDVIGAPARDVFLGQFTSEERQTLLAMLSSDEGAPSPARL